MPWTLWNPIPYVCPRTVQIRTTWCAKALPRTTAALSHTTSSHSVRVPSNRPDQDDVVCESAAVVRGRRDVDRAHPPTVDGHPSERADPRPRVPPGPVHDLRVVAKRNRRGDDHKVVV